MPVFNSSRSLYIDWRTMMVVGGNVLDRVKREGNCPGGGSVRREYVRGGMSRRKCPTLVDNCISEIKFAQVISTLRLGLADLPLLLILS